MPYMKAYVINLPRSVDRRRYMTSQLGQLGVAYELVDAVDGKTVDLDDHNLVARPRPGDTFLEGEGGPGVVGCALSHLEVYKRILADGAEHAVVLEDDVTLPGYFGELLDELAPLMTGPEVVLLNFFCPTEPHVVRVSPRDALQLAWGGALAGPVSPECVKSTGAYVISRSGCARMADMVLPVRSHPDNWEFFYQNHALERVRCVVPMPVRHSAEFRSTIWSHYQPESLPARLLEWVSHARLPIVYQTLKARREAANLRAGRGGDYAMVDAPSAMMAGASAEH